MPITPVSFEEDAQEEQNDEYDDVVDEVVEEAEQEEVVASAATIDSRMAEMEERLEMIQYYKLLLNGGFFNNPPNQSVASKIEKEVADFILTRLDSLLNMGAQPRKQVAESQFTDEEVAALKELADSNTHKALVEIASRIFSKIDKKTAKAPKTELPKLAKTTVPTETVQPKQPAPQMTVRAKEPVAKPQAAVQNPTVPAAPAVPKVVGKQKKKFKTIPKVDQKTGEVVGEVQVDATPQARPLGPIQPVQPATSKADIEARLEMSARRGTKMGLNIFDQKLNG